MVEESLPDPLPLLTCIDDDQYRFCEAGIKKMSHTLHFPLPHDRSVTHDAKAKGDRRPLGRVRSDFHELRALEGPGESAHGPPVRVTVRFKRPTYGFSRPECQAVSVVERARNWRACGCHGIVRHAPTGRRKSSRIATGLSRWEDSYNKAIGVSM